MCHLQSLPSLFGGLKPSHICLSSLFFPLSGCVMLVPSFVPNLLSAPPRSFVRSPLSFPGGWRFMVPFSFNPPCKFSWRLLHVPSSVLWRHLFDCVSTIAVGGREGISYVAALPFICLLPESSFPDRDEGKVGSPQPVTSFGRKKTVPPLYVPFVFIALEVFQFWFGTQPSVRCALRC